MPPKRPNERSLQDNSIHRTKKQKQNAARAIAVQPVASSSKAASGKKMSAPVDSMKGLPGSLDVEKFVESRAFEIRAMQEAMKNAGSSSTHRAWQELPRHLRRRAASHDVRRVPLRLRNRSRAEIDTMKRKALGRSLPKRGKANKEQRSVSFQRRQVDKKWLESHLWHAKRMKMDNMWGYRLAVQPTEKAFRPSHRASVHGSILHDASYYGLIELKGPHFILCHLLEQCSDLQGPGPGSKRYTTGVRACETALYRPNAYPFGMIGTVSLFWRASKPPGAQLMKPDAQTGTSKGSNRKRKRKQNTEDTAPNTQAVDTATRTVWVRCHPLAVKKLPEHAERKYEVEVADIRDSVNVFEIMGAKSSQVICGALTPVADERPEFKKFWSAMSDVQTPGSVPSNMITGFTALDPRLNFPPKNTKPRIDHESLPSITAPWTCFPAPTLASSDIWDEEVRDKLKSPRFQKKDIDTRKSQNAIPGSALKPTRADDTVPILLIQRSVSGAGALDTSSSIRDDDSALHGWTLIIPKGWSMPFLSSLVYTGTRVGGQRERQHQSFEAGAPYFPRDFPVTSAYDSFADAQAQQEKERWEKKPPAKRPSWGKLGSRSPWKPDWKVVLGCELPEDLVPTQRDVSTPQVKDGTPWLLRGCNVRNMLDEASKMLNPAAGLWDQVNKLRFKRDMDPVDSNPEALLQGALVRVKVTLCGRGAPEDQAVIYALNNAEVTECHVARPRSRTIAEGSEDEDEDDDADNYSEHKIIGYVTSGNFSLSRGTSFAIGAIPVKILFELQEQASHLRLEKPIVKVRNRDSRVRRAASVEALA
ncbi:POP1-domain-containing protein [Amylostereum chailletii]|nr:POP1-domain-containing protein [Amylostereum chailletii]